MWKIQWGNNSTAVTYSVHEVELLLDRLHADGDPVMVVIESLVSSDSLAIGLGRSRSVLNYVPHSCDPPYYTSTGTESRDETLVFDFMGEYSEFPGRSSVPIDLARKVVRYFLETGELSSSIAWEQD